MAVNRAAIVDALFTEALAGVEPGSPRTDLHAPVREGTALTARGALEIFESQLTSRHLDLEARRLKAKGESFYTIGSSGHEGNAAVAAALFPTDPAFLHYRAGAFFVQRARQVAHQTPILDVLLGMVASRDEPIAGGRHKVLGSRALQIPPQTSTIASHLPKAVGAAISLSRAGRLGIDPGVPEDSIVVASFGDASANHSTAAGAINAACWAAHQNLPMPLLLLCEDNGLGISVSTPPGWIESAYGHRPELHYIQADGLDIAATFDAALDAVDSVRQHRQPAFLHIKVVRILGHAGSDVEQSYNTVEEIEAREARDPLVQTARMLIEGGWISPEALVNRYEEIRERTQALGEEATRRPKLTRADEVMRVQAPLDHEAVAAEAARTVDVEARAAFWKGRLPEEDRPRHLAMQLNRGLGDLLLKYPQAILFGEDVAKKGGVYHVTAELSERTGVGRVFNTLLDEQAILGLAIGAGHMGLLPIPEIQYLAYLHNAEDQLRGEAATLQFFSQGQFKNPMVVRIAAYAYQKGFGGHFHNDNSVAVLRDIPGLVIASPSRGDDAVGCLRSCMAAAAVNGTVCAFLEPIALYMTKDLHAPGDGQWCVPYETEGAPVPIGSARTWGEGEDLTIVSFANGLWMSLRVAKRLEETHGIRARVVDLRWLNPLPAADVLREAQATGKVLLVDETRRTGGVSEGLCALLVDAGFDGKVARVTARDSFIPLGDAANLVLLQEPEIEAAALALCGKAPCGSEA